MLTDQAAERPPGVDLATTRGTHETALRRAVFLDRDGTLVHPRHYPTHPQDMVVFKGLAPVLSDLQRSGFLLILVTNQSGVARGLLTLDQLETIHDHIRATLEASGVRLDAVYYCPHHVDGIIPGFAQSCACRKPEPGMLLNAVEDLNLDPASSWMIGDILDDVEAGNRAGCRTVLVDLGTEETPLSKIRTPDYVATDPVHAANIIRWVELGVEHTDLRFRPERWATGSHREVAPVG